MSGKKKRMKEEPEKPVARRHLRRKEVRGVEILLHGGQIRRVSDSLYFVNSESNSGENRTEWADGRWSCDCEEYLEDHRPCPHIFATNLFLDLPQIALSNCEPSETACPRCGSTEYVKRGKKFNRSGAMQVLCCKQCGRRYMPSVTGTKGGVNAALGLIAIDLHFKKVSVRDIREHIWQVYGVLKPTSTLQFWITKLNKLVIKAAESIKLEVGDKWLADEFFVKIRGNMKYLWNVLDFDSRRLIASLLMDKRGADEAEKVIKEAISKAGKVPKELVHDGLKSYGEAVDTRLAGLKMKREENVALRDKVNNNRIEAFHGTLRAMVKPHRGTKNPEKLEGYAAYYNHLRPSTVNGKTPVGGTKKNTLSSFLKRGGAQIHKGTRHKPRGCKSGTKQTNKPIRR